MNLSFDSIEELPKAGFTGFQKMSNLFVDSSEIPIIKGIYLILNLDQEHPKFLELGTGGYFKGKDPNVGHDVLKSNWVEGAIVLYIDKAGGINNSANLKDRLNQYFKFGQGKNIGHRGGRLIWQLENSRDLVVCWKILISDEPRVIEKNLIQQFKSKYNQRPFANLKD